MRCLQVATGACGASTPAALPLAATGNKSDQESARMTAEDLTMKSGTAALSLSSYVKVHMDILDFWADVQVHSSFVA